MTNAAKKYCAACRAEITPTDSFHECPQCNTLYHVKCWETVDNCINPACPSQDTAYSKKIHRKKFGISKKSKIIIGISAAFVLTACVAVVLFMLFAPLNGIYTEISSVVRDETYVFNGTYYYSHQTYNKINDAGRYERKNGFITLTPQKSPVREFKKSGDYLCVSSKVFLSNIDKGSVKNQYFTCYDAYDSESYTLVLGADKSYTFTYKSLDGKGITIENGRYKISGDEIILTPAGTESTRIFIIIDDQIYFRVFLKN